MAVLGVQLVASMVMASLLAKVTPRASFAQWILCSRLVRYLHPTEAELRKLAGLPSVASLGVGKGKGRKGNQGKEDQTKELTVPKNLYIQLESSPVTALDVLPLRFYTDFQWLVDFSACTVVIFLLTELYVMVVRPSAEVNLSMLWCLLVLGFALKVMFSLTAIYFRSEDSGEMIMCIAFGFFFLVLAMGILVVDDNTLEFGIQEAYSNFSAGARHFLEEQGIQSAGPASLLTFRIILAVVAAIFGAFMTFPGLRLARMYSDALRYASDRPFLQVALHVNMIFPMVVSLMWLRPVVRDYVVREDGGFPGRSSMLLTHEMFDVVRILTVFAFLLLRFLLLWTHLQAYLNMAWDRLERLRKEAGRISALELQRMVTRVFYYLCVVALQYLTPLIFLLFSVLMLKTLGGYSLTGAFGIPLPEGRVSPTPVRPAASSMEEAEGIVGKAAQFSVALASLREVFTPACFKALFSFLCWWICSTWFTTSAFGMVYYSYFEI